MTYVPVCEKPRAASPQATVDTPAKLARDAMRMLEGYAESYESMAKMDSPSGDGTVQCRSVARDIRANMAGWFGPHLTEQATATQPAQTTLTDEQRVAIRECIDYLTPAAKQFSDLGIPGIGDSKHARCIRTLRALLTADARAASPQATATPYRWSESEHIIGSGNGIRDIARHIHWPECWDMAAYPSLAHAVHETILSAAFHCGNDDCKHVDPQATATQPCIAPGCYQWDGTDSCTCQKATAAQPAQTDDTRDAERYRWLREHWGYLSETYDADSSRMVSIDLLQESLIEDGWDVEPTSLDAAVDANLAGAQPASGGDRDA
jgi:hypothetical protein